MRNRGEVCPVEIEINTIQIFRHKKPLRSNIVEKTTRSIVCQNWTVEKTKFNSELLSSQAIFTMSLSTLGAQLAALNGSSQGGIGLPSSRRHEDAVGRGMHHSVQVGHAVANKSHIYKASILYETAREASNVPLTTLQENCVAALEELAGVDPYFETVVSSITKNVERGLLTKQENESLDEVIQQLMYRLGVHMTNADLVAPGLNVVEYLIRGFDLHLRPKLVSTVLLVWLPHHENAYFLRWIQLVDLVSVPTYTWLRAYAIPNAKVGRDVIAKAVSKNLALCRAVLDLSTKAAALPNADVTLSFSAAVMVEAISLQHRAAGTMEERTGRALLPVVQRACLAAAKNPLFANWGYVMASTIVETSSLADSPRKDMVLSILRGIEAKSSKQDVDDDGDTEMLDTSARGAVDDEMIQNALIVVLSFLQQQPSVESYRYADADDEKDEKVLSQIVVGDKKTVFGYPNASIVKSKAFWRAILRINNLASRLSQLLIKDGYVDVLHLITSLWTVGWKLAQDSQRDPKSISALEQFLLNLLHEDGLLQHIWSKPEWIEALVSFVLVTVSIPDKKKSKTGDGSTLQKVLETLRQQDASAYERGIAYALLRLKYKTRAKLANYLGLATEGKLTGNPSEGNAVLPPRVALNNVDVEIRLHAVDRLMNEQDQSDIAKLFIDKIVSEDTAEVARKISTVLCDLVDKKGKKKHGATIMSMLGSRDLSSTIIKGLYKWYEYPDSDSKPQLVRNLVHLTASAASSLFGEKGSEMLFVQLLEGVVASMAHEDANISKEAAGGVMIALSAKKKKAKVSDTEALQELMTNSRVLLKYLSRSMDEDESRMAEIIRRRCIPSFLKGYAESFNRASSPVSEEQFCTAFEYCCWVLRTHGNSLASDERAMLFDVFKRTTKHVVARKERFFSLLSTILDVDGVLLEDVGLPLALELCSNFHQRDGKKATPVAVVMEICLRPDTASNIIENLLRVASTTIQETKSSGHFGLVYTLSLLTHPDPDVRKAAIKLIEAIGRNLNSRKDAAISSLVKVCDYIKANETSAVMGGHVFLVTCMREIGSLPESQKIIPLLLQLTLCAVGAKASDDSLEEQTDLASTGFLEVEDAIGGHTTATAILKAMEEVGGNSFPISKIWTCVAKPTIEFLFRLSTIPGIPLSMQTLLKRFVELLKGTRVSLPNDEELSNVIIMSGPSSGGGRKRSYSFGKSEPAHFIQPYPKELSSGLVIISSSKSETAAARYLRNAVFSCVLGCPQWCQHVFLKLPQKTRQQIVASMLEAIIEDRVDSTDAFFFSLPLVCSDVVDLMKMKKGLAFITYLSDFVCANSNKLALQENGADLIASLLEHFVGLSRFDTSADDGGNDFARTSILGAISESIQALMAQPLSQGLELNKKMKFKQWIEAMVGALDPSEEHLFRTLNSNRGKKLIASVLADLSTLYPDAVSAQLIPAVSAVVLSVTKEKEVTIVSDILGVVVPAYFSLPPSTKYSPLDLMEAFIAAVNENSEGKPRIHLYQSFIEALLTFEKSNEAKLLGSFLSCCLAADIFYSRKNEESIPVSTSVLQQCVGQVSVTKRAQSVLAVVSYAKDAVLLLGGEKPEEVKKPITLDELLKLVGVGPKVAHPSLSSKKVSTKIDLDGNMGGLCLALLSSSCDVISSHAFARYLRQSKNGASESVVKLWQDLLLIQSVCNNKLGTGAGRSDGIWLAALDIVNETLDTIQRHLPSPLFLAFATSLVKESDSEDLRSRAVQLIADRALELDPLNTESYLFMDMLPYLTSLVVEDTTIIQQAAMVAIEHITRKLCLDRENLASKYTDSIAQALVAISKLFNDHSLATNLKDLSAGGQSASSTQLLCTASLCAATAVRTCQARALPSLPRLIPSLLKLFGDANDALEAVSEADGSDKSYLQVLQLSSLRLILAIVESIPQFLTPYFGDLFRPTILSSPSQQQVQDDQSLAVQAASKSLRNAIAMKIPARQLLSPLVSALAMKTNSSLGITAMIDILITSIQHAKSKEIGGKMESILKAGTFVFDFAQTSDLSKAFVSLATDMLQAFVLKLSELQLRSFYGKLRLWRGDFDTQDPAKQAFRRYCFWSFSSSLAKELKSIYLPCLASVFSDAVNELVSFLSSLEFLMMRTGIYF